MRGEQRDSLIFPRILDGSSPHAWGTVEGMEIPIDEERFIPTCVGNSDKVPVRLDGATVHPHMRGEQY